jgi:hypothetical protein
LFGEQFGGGPIGSDGSTRNLIDPSHRKFHYRSILKARRSGLDAPFTVQAGATIILAGSVLHLNDKILRHIVAQTLFVGEAGFAHVWLTSWVKTNRRS